MEYLCHIVGCDAIRVDPKKIQAMKDWPWPKTLNIVRGLLGLIGYYSKFVYNYGKIARPLTGLPKKNTFSWDDPVEKSFISLQNAMCSTPVLVVLDLTKPFVLKCDTLGTCIGVVLTQVVIPLTLISKPLCDFKSK